MKKNYLRLPFVIKIILLTSLLLAGKFSREYSPQYTSDSSIKKTTPPDSMQATTYQKRVLIEYVNWASER